MGLRSHFQHVPPAEQGSVHNSQLLKFVPSGASMLTVVSLISNTLKTVG